MIFLATVDILLVVGLLAALAAVFFQLGRCFELARTLGALTNGQKLQAIKNKKVDLFNFFCYSTN